IGVGLPGPVDVDKGMMSVASPQSHVPEFHGVPVAEQIQALTELPTFVDNDVNALALGERAFGLGRGAASFAVLAIGTEIGGAFVAGDVLLRGAHGFGGELGHVPVNFAGPRCGCGGRGCLGAYLGGRQLAAEARRRVMDGASSTLVERAAGDIDAITSSMVFAGAAAGDRLAQMLVDEACEALAAALAMIVNGLDPDLIVITGGVAESLVPLHADVVRRTAAYAFAHPLGSTRIQITRSDKRDTVRGGAALFAYERAREHARRPLRDRSSRARLAPDLHRRPVLAVAPPAVRGKSRPHLPERLRGLADAALPEDPSRAALAQRYRGRHRVGRRDVARYLHRGVAPDREGQRLRSAAAADRARADPPRHEGRGRALP